MFYTGMFNGLKKIVGKAADDTSNINHPQSLVHPMQNMVPNKFTKKQKIVKISATAEKKHCWNNLKT